MDKEKSCRVFLNMVPGIGPKAYEALLSRFGTADEALRATFSELREVLGEQLTQKLRDFTSRAGLLDKEIELIEKNGIKVICLGDHDYPEAFKPLDSAPPVIYVKGDTDFFKHELVLSIVGTRRPTEYGKRVACDLTEKIVESGFNTASGFALGVDSIVHRTTLRGDAATAAVLGCGLLVDYPYANRDIREAIASKGVLLSEFPLRYPPIPENFPRRNRLISALGMGTLVIEADHKSGSMITVGDALNQGKDVFAVPGSIYSPYSRGTNRLISQGARLVVCVDDILNELSSRTNLEFKFVDSASNRGTREEVDALDENERRILKLIGWDPVSIDNITSKSNVLSYELAKVLIDLELKGFVKSMPGKQYIRMK